MRPSTSQHLALSADGELFQGYPLSAGAYDEAFAASGTLRPHWQQMIRALNTLGVQELTRRWDHARRVLYEHGVTYNVYGDPQGVERPWELDAIPLVIAPEEWHGLEVALVQRAQLLNTLLSDVYGPQRLLSAGILPPELVFAHAGFLRPCHGLRVPNNCYLHLYAADLARSPDGQWWVLADRVQSPAGAAYALENRLVLSRMLSDVFRDCHVRPLAPFFETLRQTLLSLAPRHRDNPRIVLLTPGPYNETYFEHAYLARYLGYTLVEGGDLTVRDYRVFLKTLSGLQPVDVILRRQDDTFCDPLELHQGSVLGTAGLVHAARLGNVATANALGSGWLDTPAVMPFLPVLCRHLLGEELKLPSVPTWWCGQQESLAYVQDHLEKLVLAPALQTYASQEMAGNSLSRAQQKRLAATLQTCSYALVAQEQITPSTVPVWSGENVRPQHAVIRAYVVATAGGYTVMPGGLGRATISARPVGVSMQQGGGSKDMWVLSAEPLVPLSLTLPAGQPIEIRRSDYDLPSRVADNLFWLGRYAERAESAMRLLRYVLTRLTDEAGPGSSAAFPILLRALRETWNRVPLAGLDGSHASLEVLEQALLAVIFDAQRSDSLRAMLTALHGVAARVRDRISLDAWRILTRLDQDFTQPRPHSLIPLSEALELLNSSIITLAAFSGLGVENMTRGLGWRFLDMGRRLERAVYTVSLLRSLLIEAVEHETAVLETLLQIADSPMDYRSRYLATPQCAPVLDLILTDDTNPRAVAYQLVALAEHVENLPRDHARPALSPAQRLTMTALSSLRLTDIETLCEVGDGGQRWQLEALLTQLHTDLPALADTLTHHYLSHAEPSRHLAVSIRTSPQ
jgi:uncharacterized circularly permuted ATP-grasp superfamily protein/uncharacterized alpha-E superfamily protein